MTEKAQLVYLAGPVRVLGRSSAIDVRRPLENFFMQRGMVTFNPPGAWGAPIVGSDAIEATVKLGNDAMLAMSNIMATIFIPGVESTGTDEEMMLAAKLRINTMVIVHDRSEISDAIAWANPLIGQANITGRISIEFAVLRGTKLETVTIISYEPQKEEAVG